MNVGDKVVCVDDTVTSQVKISLFQNWVEEGEAYTVRSIEGSFNSEPRILVDELRNESAFFPELGGKAEPGFAGKRFVPYDDYVMSSATVEELTEETSLVE